MKWEKKGYFWEGAKGQAGIHYDVSSQDGVIYIWHPDNLDPRKSQELCEKIEQLIAGEKA